MVLYLNPDALVRNELLSNEKLCKLLNGNIFTYYVPETEGLTRGEAEKIVTPSLIVRTIESEESLQYDGEVHAYHVKTSLSVVTKTNEELQQIGDELVKWFRLNNFRLSKQKNDRIPQHMGVGCIFVFENELFDGEFYDAEQNL